MIDLKKEFSDLIFKEKNHKYYLRGRELTSVTTLIKKYKSEFDAAYVSSKVAEKQDISVADVLTMWGCNRDTACALGTAFHFYVEMYFKNYFWDTYPAHLYEQINKFNSFWINNRDRFLMVACELRVYDEELGIAGTVDALVQNKKTGKFSIWDWKTNKSIKTENKFSSMKGCLSDLDDCDFNHYSLQISIYTEILKRKFPDLEFITGSLIHFPYNQHYEIMKIKDLSAEAIKILA